MLLFDEMISCPERDKVGIVRRSRYGHTAGASDVSVTQLVGQHLNLVRAEVVVVPQHVIVRWPTGSLPTTTHSQHQPINI